MARRSVNELILSFRDFFKNAQPDMDTKPGTVARDLFINAPASQISILYDELSTISSNQSLRLVIGSNLDKFAKNFGLTRKQALPSLGVALLTFSSIDAPFAINAGNLINSINGFTFSVVNGVAINPASANFYRSIAIKYKDQLDSVGITDQYAIEVTVKSTTAGSAGNIGKFSLSSTNIPNISNVTNINTFVGGVDQETDAVFRNRILSTFSGSSVGTYLGYLNTALAVNGVLDALVIEPGDSLMVRDGTITTKDRNGNITISSEGSGGKIDIITLGSNLLGNIDSFIYIDKSNKLDATSTKNNYVLGQFTDDVKKTINRRRIDNIKSGRLPAQPVENILKVSGSSSGTNFKEKSIDEYGRISGNYELLKDTGIYGGSPWGSDTFRWISNKIVNFVEDKSKGQSNGQDKTVFTDVLKINKCQQNILITNENSQVTSDRSIIQLFHTPLTNVSRVFNVNTGERYLVENQNLDSNNSINYSGKIKIRGNNLPSSTDIIQVDYTWIVDFDIHHNIDGLDNTNNIRQSVDSIDWSYASQVKNEKVKFTLSTDNQYFIGRAQNLISSIVSVKQMDKVNSNVYKISSGIYINKLAVQFLDQPTKTNTIFSINKRYSKTELYHTKSNDGTFIKETYLDGITVLNKTTIILPSDTLAVEGDIVEIKFNDINVYYSSTYQGSFNGNIITIPSELINTTNSYIDLYVNYIASTNEIVNDSILNLPLYKAGTGFLSKTLFNNKNVANNIIAENKIVETNLSSQKVINLTIDPLNYYLTTDDVLSVVRVSDGMELYNKNNSPILLSLNTYQLVLNYNSPLNGDRVLVVYNAYSLKKSQPITFKNYIINYDVENVQVSGANKFVNLASIKADIGPLNFQIIDPLTNNILLQGSDGYLEDGGFLYSNSSNFSTISNISKKFLKINSKTYNYLYDISVAADNFIQFSKNLDGLSLKNISVYRLRDGKELSISNLNIDARSVNVLDAATNEKVIVVIFDYDINKSSFTRLNININDQIINPGNLTISGTTINKAENIVFTATSSNLKQSLAEALRKALKLNTTNLLPGNIFITKLISLEKVNTVSSYSDEILNTISTLDISNVKINKSNYFNDSSIEDKLLNFYEIELANVPANKSKINIGDKLKVTFYYINENDVETLYFIRNGNIYSNKLFATIDSISVGSGFNNSLSTKMNVSNFLQPSQNSKYKISYDYVAPKQNERISIEYNYNKIISDVTFEIENARPINADVLVFEAKEIKLDIIMNIVIDTNYINSTNSILQQARDILIQGMTKNKLNEIVDTVDLLNDVKGITGISRARIIYFNKNGVQGNVNLIRAQKNEYFVYNNIELNIETR